MKTFSTKKKIEKKETFLIKEPVRGRGVVAYPRCYLLILAIFSFPFIPSFSSAYLSDS